MLLPLQQTTNKDLSLLQTKWKSILDAFLGNPLLNGAQFRYIPGDRQKGTLGQFVFLNPDGSFSILSAENISGDPGPIGQVLTSNGPGKQASFQAQSAPTAPRGELIFWEFAGYGGASPARVPTYAHVDTSNQGDLTYDQSNGLAITIGSDGNYIMSGNQASASGVAEGFGFVVDFNGSNPLSSISPPTRLGFNYGPALAVQLPQCGVPKFLQAGQIVRPWTENATTPVDPTYCQMTITKVSN